MLNSEPMTKTDFAWYRMDTKYNLMVINLAMLFDNPLNIKALRQTVHQRLAAYPRFSQRVITVGSKNYWQKMTEFDCADHIQHIQLAEKPNKLQLQQHLSDLAQVPLQKDRPLWSMNVLENPDASFTVMFRVHHCIADGVAAMHLVESLTDAMDNNSCTSESNLPEQAIAADSPFSVIRLKVNHLIHIVGIAWEMTKLSLMFNDADSLLKRKNGTAKQLCWSESLALAQVKAVGEQHQATVNDVLCTAITGGLLDYLTEQNNAVHGDKIRVAVAMNLRDNTRIQTLENAFGLVALPIPLNRMTPLSRLHHIKTRMTQLKNSRQAYTTEPVLWIMGCLPLPLQRFVMTRLMNKYSLVISNLTGPASIRSLAGAKMTELLFWVPQTGNMGLGISIISYAGRICFGLFADETRIRQPERIMSLCCQHFQDLAQSSS